ncbi:TM0106 family RecB-like putative nuclease [Candidatus Pelagibacter sp. HIMB1746]|uniref:TM0106 family RecB-like putative nuclease n=1 Tax=Candidatus Pelagibacter sp. HIMB1746 TaxID=3413370 RepID=UPI003F829E08
MKNLYSPSMLKSYLSCKYTIFNEVNEKKLNLKKIELSKNDQLRLEKGNIHEKNYLKELRKKYKKVIDLKNTKLSKEEKVPKTIQAMKEGWEVIHGGYLQRNKWRGEFDFLIINKDLKSKFGDYSYEVIDTKNSNKPKPDHIIQLGMYTYMLEQTQGVLPKRFTIVLKDMIEENVQVNQVNEFFKTHRENYEKFVSNGIDKTKPEKCGFCQICSWKEECEKIWVKEDNLNQVGGLTKVHLKKLLQLKIDTTTKLSKQDSKKNLKGFREEISYKLITQAKLQKEYEKTNVPIHQPNPRNLDGIKGFNSLPEPSACDLYFDIESVEDHIYPGGLEYLLGIYYIEDDKEKFKALWSHNKEEEKQNVINFFEFTKSHFEKYPSSKIYHYGSYEITALLKLTSLHKVKGIEYDHYMNLDKFVNLLNVNTQGLFISENSYSLKNIEKFYNFKRVGDVQKGDVSQEYYSEWVETQDQKYLDEIESYNKQDCRSTYELHKWLLDIKPKETSWFTSQKKDNEMDLRDWEVDMLAYQDKVEKSKIKNPQIKQLMADIIGFYNREDKPAWREFFERRTKSDEELIDDPECIGDMKLNGKPTPEKRSLIYAYKFEDQDFKLRKSKRAIIANNQDIEQKDNAGTIIDIDYKTKEVLLKRGTASGMLPEILSIGPDKPRANNKLISNTYKFIDSLINKENKYNALNNFLEKKHPKIKGIKTGDKLISSEQFDKEIPKIISNLENSYLYIQGPPGTGKTYQAANAIIELLKQNKKIAITGLSHKVIHNLLQRIEDMATEKQFEFEGYKRGTLEDEDTVFNGEYIKTYEKDPVFMDALKELNVGQIYAGTKYHLASTFYDEKIDYLFIDEAGQVSLADLISIGNVAKNIILIGDQNQLGQPIRGIHPNESGQSILDYLLEGKDTIPEDRGIFLNKTYRLNSKLNNFISSNFYEERLICDERTDKRLIKFNKKTKIQDIGIHYIEMSHTNNVQTSIEEFEVIRDLMKEMIGLEFDDQGNKRQLTVNDFLIISPYNTQVNLLISKLEESKIENPRVGTIDKFQGQEAPITIISMTSSDSDSLPRNKEFFFSRNRLNVAISRAQVASIILFNPNLLDSSPKNLDHIKLMNNFFKILNFKI